MSSEAALLVDYIAADTRVAAVNFPEHFTQSIDHWPKYSSDL